MAKRQGQPAEAQIGLHITAADILNPLQTANERPIDSPRGCKTCADCARVSYC